jgi:transposase
MADDLDRETIPGVARASRCPHPTRLLTPICSRKRGKARQVDGAATGPVLALDKIRRRFPWLDLIWADGGYNAWQVEAAVAKVPPLRLEIVKRRDDKKGFVVLPRRWVVERTFSWFGRNRRLAKDFENLAETLATFVILASIQLPSGGSAGRGLRSAIHRDEGRQIGL